MGTATSDVEQPGAAIPFKIEGGGTVSSATTTLSYPATRIPVTVTIEGVDHPFILDTGASEVTVRASLFAALAADGRTVMQAFPVGTPRRVQRGAAVTRAAA